MLVHISIPTPHFDAYQKNYIMSCFRGWTTDAAFAHTAWAVRRSAPPPKERLPPLEKKNGSKFFVELYNKLIKTHSGKFHESSSINNSKLLDFLQEILQSNFKLTPVITKGKWCEIDTPLDLERAKKMFS